MANPPSPDIEMICRPGCAACAPIACAMALAIEPCTQEPTRRRRPFIGEIARGPDRGRADIGGEDRIVGGLLAEQAREILRVDRLVAGRALGEFVESRAGFLVMRAAGVEMLAVALRLELRQQRLDGGADVTDDAEVELAAAAEILRPDIDLGDFGVGRQKLLVGKIGPQHQQHVAGVHGGVAGGEADEAGHADIVGIVVLDVFLAAERMHHRALERLGKLHQAVMGAGAAAAAEQRDAPGAIQQFGQRRQFRFGRPNDGGAGSSPALGEMPRLGAALSATSPGITRTATPRLPTAARMAFSST